MKGAHLLNAVQDLAIRAVLLVRLVMALLLGHPCHRRLIVQVLGGHLRLDIVGAGHVLKVTWGLLDHLHGELRLTACLHAGFLRGRLGRRALRLNLQVVERLLIAKHVFVDLLDLLLPLHL